MTHMKDPWEKFNPHWNPNYDADRKKQQDKQQYQIRKERRIRLDSRWTKLRRETIKAHPYCNRCSSFGTEVHHILSRSARPDLLYEPSNLEVLCNRCHIEHHRHDKDHPVYKTKKYMMRKQEKDRRNSPINDEEK